MERADFKTKLPCHIGKREMERVATEDPEVIGIPLIVRVGVIGVEPHTIRVVFEVEHVGITVGVDCALSRPFHHRLIALTVVFYS